jgi:hypothetical protein
VGVTPGVSEDDSVDGDVSVPEEELIELMLLFIGPGAISFLGIEFIPPEFGNEELFDSKDGLDSPSSLNLESWEDLGVPALSAASKDLGESVLGIFIGTSLRGGTLDRPPPDVDLDTLLSLNSDCELLLEAPDFFPFGTSPSLNLSGAAGCLPLELEGFGELACCTRVSLLPIAGDAFVDSLPPDCALRMLSFICEVSSVEGWRPFS